MDTLDVKEGSWPLLAAADLRNAAGQLWARSIKLQLQCLRTICVSWVLIFFSCASGPVSDLRACIF